MLQNFKLQTSDFKIRLISEGKCSNAKNCFSRTDFNFCIVHSEKVGVNQITLYLNMFVFVDSVVFILFLSLSCLESLCFSATFREILLPSSGKVCEMK